MHSLECDNCGEDVFTRDTDAYAEGEECVCPTCLEVCIVAIDDAEEPATAYCDSEGGSK